jgi:hypothetical protein
MKSGKKFFIILSLVAILASLFVTVASAQSIRTELTALQVDKYSVASTPSLTTLEFVGSMPCSGIVLSAYTLSSKDIYVTIQTPKNVQTWMCVPQKTFTKSISLTNLVPGASYTVYINKDSGSTDKGAQGIRVFTFVVPQPFKP